MSRHVIVGGGAIGTATANLLAEYGERVILITRSGTGPDIAGVERVQADAAEPSTLTALASGASVLYNCASPAYHRWGRDWPPLAAALLQAAERSGSVLATVSNLYGYGPVAAPMTETTPLNATSTKGRIRARMWLDALALHDAGRIRATEVRSSDYIGPGAQSPLGDRVVPRVLANKRISVIGSADALHTWTYTLDVAQLLVKVGDDERAWGRAWHVPSNPPRSQRQAIRDLARAAGLAAPSVTELPPAVLRAIGLVKPTVRELGEIAYQLKEPFILDSTASQQTFGLAPTPWPDVLTATLASHQTRTGTSLNSRGMAESMASRLHNRLGSNEGDPGNRYGDPAGTASEASPLHAEVES
jgi:nucleoside-diphosphate-sugar epimerase